MYYVNLYDSGMEILARLRGPKKKNKAFREYVTAFEEFSGYDCMRPFCRCSRSYRLLAQVDARVVSDHADSENAALCVALGGLCTLALQSG